MSPKLLLHLRQSVVTISARAIMVIAKLAFHRRVQGVAPTILKIAPAEYGQIVLFFVHHQPFVLVNQHDKAITAIQRKTEREWQMKTRSAPEIVKPRVNFSVFYFVGRHFGATTHGVTSR